MQVSLKVIGGKNDGREIKISVPKFIIGRGENAHLRPASDLVSRNHCAIVIGDGKVTIEDLGSRNGTFVNGDQLSAAHTVQVGDTLRVGRLTFELVLDHAKPGNKKPKVENVVEAAARTKKQPSSIEDSITDWLVDDADGGAHETVQFNLEETMALSKANAEKRKDEDTKATHDSVGVGEQETVESDTKERKKKKDKPGKLPNVPKLSHESSKNAADDVLRKFFNRR